MGRLLEHTSTISIPTSLESRMTVSVFVQMVTHYFLPIERVGYSIREGELLVKVKVFSEINIS